ncbi:MAG: alpha-L-fucosidase [Caldilineaceae bacterium]
MLPANIRPPTGDASWFLHDRFGLFIHWGLYAHPLATSGSSTVNALQARITRSTLTIDPDLYDPQAWAKAAKAAGMKYFVITTKHHEGFCLWDTTQTDYKVTNTPYGKDLLGPMVDAFRSEVIKVGFYHSVIDQNTDFPVDKLHPQRRR